MTSTTPPAIALLILGAGCLLPACGQAIDYPSAWSCDASKFHWYCDVMPDAELPTEGLAALQPDDGEKALAALDALRKSLEASRAIALMAPTEENVRAYIAAQEAMMDRASLFSDVWRRVVWANPDLNYQLRNPVNNLGIQVRAAERSQREKDALKRISREWGLFFVFRADCPFCHQMGQALRQLSETYGITVFPVSLDGGALEGFPEAKRDNGLAAMLEVRQVPYVALGNVRDRRIVPLGSGLLSVQDLVERIYILTQTKPGELY